MSTATWPRTACSTAKPLPTRTVLLVVPIQHLMERLTMLGVNARSLQGLSCSVQPTGHGATITRPQTFQVQCMESPTVKQRTRGRPFSRGGSLLQKEALTVRTTLSLSEQEKQIIVTEHRQVFGSSIQTMSISMALATISSRSAC